jgi:hypothetical protein
MAPDRRAYATLASAIVLVAAALTIVGAPRRAAKEPPAVPAAAPAAAIALAIGAEGSLFPPATTVVKGARVMLSVTNRRDSPVVVALPGYDDRLPPFRLGPGETWHGAFLADRPGDDFAWMIDGAAVGRFSVTGSHLVEGHR